MNDDFHKRFNIEMDLKEAERRFVNRVENVIFDGLLSKFSDRDMEHVSRLVATILGERYEDGEDDLTTYTKEKFLPTLHVIEDLYEVIPSKRSEIDEIVKALIKESEVNLSICWKKGKFFREGAPILDEKLVNNVLGWFESPHLKSVLSPFQKGLRHLLDSESRPELVNDVITDMYETLEALTKIVTGRPDKDLSANRELFLSKVKASEKYKQILKDYIDYGNDFRHAAKPETPHPQITLKEAESFVYLTGLFIRLAMPET